MSSAPSINSPSFPPPSEEYLQKKKTQTRRVIIGIALSLISLTGLENYVLQQRTSDGTPIANNIAVLVLFNIILILLFILLLLITRNLVKLYNERKSKILGSKFQTKLIVAFLILALFPSILLVVVASKLFSFSVGHWFSLQVEQSLSQSMQVAREYYSHLEKRGLHGAKMIETRIARNKLYLSENRGRLDSLIEYKVEEYGLSGIIVYDNNFRIVTSKIDPAIPPDNIDLNYSDLIKKSADAEGVSEIRTANKGDFMVVVVPLSQNIDGKTSIWGYIVALNQIPRSISQTVASIRATYEDYKQQSLLKLPVSANYYITFLLVTLLILFSAIWLGFYLARGITIPIQQLAEGTRRIAGGDLNFKINIDTSDEIGLLVNSFNTMTTEISENRKKLQWANEDLKSINIELDRRRCYIETILENIGAGVISIDKRGCVTTLNKAAKRTLNIDHQDVLGSSYKHVFDQSFHNPIRKMMKRMLHEQREFYEEQIEIMVGENHLTLLLNIRVLRDAGKKYLGVVILFEDLTQMIKAQKIAAWKEVAQGIAHEIKNPLTPIQLNAQLLRKKFYENKEDFTKIFDESIRIINQEVEGMKKLLNEFLRFARMPMPNLRPIVLHKIIDDVAKLYVGHDKNMVIKKNYDPNITLLHIDEEQMRRVFINLFVNAVDAINSNGIIEINTRFNAQSKKVKIEFSDNGIGIASSDRDKLFLPHFTTKKRGTGLGLAIVHRIIADHNGIIQARDNYPKGTVFIIELPSFPTAFNSTSPLAQNRN